MGDNKGAQRIRDRKPASRKKAARENIKKALQAKKDIRRVSGPFSCTDRGLNVLTPSEIRARPARRTVRTEVEILAVDSEDFRPAKERRTRDPPSSFPHDTELLLPAEIYTMAEDRAEKIKKHITSYPDFPKPGIVFRDVFSILMKPDLAADLMALMEEKITTLCPDVEVIVGLDSRGFLFGMPLALTLKKPFVPIRKKGKLPGVLKSVTYSLEYGTDVFEAQNDSIKPGQKVVIVDDLLATGGTMGAACKLVSDMGGDVKLCLVCIELADLKGREKVPNPCHNIVQY